MASKYDPGDTPKEVQHAKCSECKNSAETCDCAGVVKLNNTSINNNSSNNDNTITNEDENTNKNNSNTNNSDIHDSTNIVSKSSTPINNHEGGAHNADKQNINSKPNKFKLRAILVENLDETIISQDVVSLFGLDALPFIQNNCICSIIESKLDSNEKSAIVFGPSYLLDEIIKLCGIDFRGKTITIKYVPTSSFTIEVNHSAEIDANLWDKNTQEILDAIGVDIDANDTNSWFIKLFHPTLNRLLIVSTCEEIHKHLQTENFDNYVQIKCIDGIEFYKFLHESFEEEKQHKLSMIIGMVWYGIGTIRIEPAGDTF